ncbi:thermonuclease family protein [Inmirania thermothiophila]|uniref:Endonuclease YncB(Thermonuclease family) n=1 Tax=Inmirania thermothiophila TaxID=1750597 RepID=A0A3N1Y5P0_9GAMM|nr:thermonuclease family protein [Inmirania thermothiophila]ROR34129.1 endonuclease YncB(thermonuclease family) [Inmirania thermothiophila]
MAWPARIETRAPRWGALVLLGLALALAGPARAGCLAGAADEVVRVRHVIDGDTLVLAGGRHLRLIGIDTPELGRDGRPDEPLAREARGRLEALVAGAQGRLRLRYDAERADGYGRLLAHALLPDGRTVEEVLLREGLAVSLVVPPNVAGLACYRRAEAEARSARRGLWALARYQRQDAARARLEEAGRFVWLEGEVAAVRRTRRSVWLELRGGVAVRVAREDWAWFEGIDWQRLRGRRVGVRGIPYRGGGAWRIRLRHPVDLEIGGGS